MNGPPPMQYNGHLGYGAGMYQSPMPYAPPYQHNVGNSTPSTYNYRTFPGPSPYSHSTYSAPPPHPGGPYTGYGGGGSSLASRRGNSGLALSVPGRFQTDPYGSPLLTPSDRGLGGQSREDLLKALLSPRAPMDYNTYSPGPYSLSPRFRSSTIKDNSANAAPADPGRYAMARQLSHHQIYDPNQASPIPQKLPPAPKQPEDWSPHARDFHVQKGQQQRSHQQIYDNSVSYIPKRLTPPPGPNVEEDWTPHARDFHVQKGQQQRSHQQIHDNSVSYIPIRPAPPPGPRVDLAPPEGDSHRKLGLRQRSHHNLIDPAVKFTPVERHRLPEHQPSFERRVYFERKPQVNLFEGNSGDTYKTTYLSQTSNVEAPRKQPQKGVMAAPWLDPALDSITVDRKSVTETSFGAGPHNNGLEDKKKSHPRWWQRRMQPRPPRQRKEEA